MKKPFGRCTVHAATNITATKPAAGMGVSSPNGQAEACRHLGGGGDARVEHAGLHAHAVEPACGTCQPALPEELVIAVRGHRQAEHNPQEQKDPEVVRQSRNRISWIC